MKTKKLVQINVTAGFGSTGKIAEQIGQLAIENGWESWIAYGRGNPMSKSNLIRIGNDFDKNLHAIQTRLLDNHGLASKRVTKMFVKQIEEINPDVIHLHNIHGYYLNYPILFKFLKEWGGPVVWTLHDCWPFTGHCAYYDYIQCHKWQTQCTECPNLKSFPKSILIDRSCKNYNKKKESFIGLDNLILVPVSKWLEKELGKSFLSMYPTHTIHNGIDLNTFRLITVDKKYRNHKIILGVASVWDKRKGLDEFIKLRKLLPSDYEFILVGLSQKQVDSLPSGIKGIQRTENVHQLVELYNSVDVFVNPTLEDNFPTTNLEALACGTPVVTYNTGGSPEAIDGKTGIVVDYKNVEDMAKMIQFVCDKRPFCRDDCRDRAQLLFNKDDAYNKYISLYNDIVI